MKEFHINSAAEGGGECVAGATWAETAAACVRDAKRAFGGDDNNMTRAMTTFVVANANESWRIFAVHKRELAVQKT